MTPDNILTFVEWAWTIASAGAVLLSLWTIPRALRVRRDMKADLTSLSADGGLLSFAQQQLREGGWLLTAHFLALSHQLLFFAIGLYAVFEKNEPLPIGTPLMEVVGVPLTLLFAQYLIVFLQVCVIAVTFEQEKWRRQSLERRNP